MVVVDLQRAGKSEGVGVGPDGDVDITHLEGGVDLGARTVVDGGDGECSGERELEVG